MSGLYAISGVPYISSHYVIICTFLIYVPCIITPLFAISIPCVTDFGEKENNLKQSLGYLLTLLLQPYFIQERLCNKGSFAEVATQTPWRV